MNESYGPYLRAQWRFYAERIAVGLATSGTLMLTAVLTTRWWLLPLGALGILLVAWFYAASTWQIRYRLDAQKSAEIAWENLDLDGFAKFICIEAGMRSLSLRLSRRLQRGSLKIIDVYNPQMMPNPALARLRIVAQSCVVSEAADPRAIWLEGRVGQLPQRDESVPAVVIDQVLSELVQEGDRLRLLNEAFRALEPGGRLVIIDRTQQPTNAWALAGGLAEPDLLTLLSARQLTLMERVPVNNWLVAFVTAKPTPQASQLRFNF